MFLKELMRLQMRYPFEILNSGRYVNDALLAQVLKKYIEEKATF